MSVEILLPVILLVASLAYLARFGPAQAASAPAAAAQKPAENAGASGPAHLRGAGGPGADCFHGVCEVDGFETIRKHVGYKAANALLAQIAAVLGEALPACEIGRINRTSVEFAWTATDASDEIERAHAQLPRTLKLEGCALDIRPRIGFRPVRAENAEGAFEEIDAALADPASQHLDRLATAVADESASEERLYLLKELSAAISNDRLEIHYQPKLNCRTERVASVEALLRWTHFSLGTISPDRVIAAAEETGLIRRLTTWVLARVIEDSARLSDAGLELPVYVNLSGALLPDERFAATVMEMVRGREHLIGFEITETAVIRDPGRAIANLAAFRRAGIGVAIDDYGSGLSSLAYLKQLPAQELKIDRLFISGLTSEQRDPLLVRSSIELAHALEMKVVAEGVDDAMTLSLLTVMGCDMVQGYLISKPLPLDLLITFLARDSHVDHIAAAPAPRFAERAATLTGR